MKLFKWFDFQKEGPGVYEDDLPKSGLKLLFNVIISNFWRLISLNIIFLLYCIPIITIPAAVTALCKISCDMLERNYILLWKDFFAAFKQNFFQSLIFGLMVAVLIPIFYFGYQYYLFIPKSIMLTIWVVLVIFFILIGLMMGLYIPVMIGKVKLGIRAIINNSFRLAFMFYIRNIATLAILITLVLAMIVTFPLSIIAALLCLFSYLGLIVSFNALPVIKKYAVASGDDGIDEL